MIRVPSKLGGGGHTNEYGLLFERTADLNEALRDAGFDTTNKYDIHYSSKSAGGSVNKRVFPGVSLSTNGINCLGYNSKHWDSGEAFINEFIQTVCIAEKKF